MKVLLFWAALLALWTAVQAIFSPHLITVLLLGGAAVAVALTAFVAQLARPARGAAPSLSPSTPLIALGVAALLSGSELGTWCIALGALMTAAGLAGLLGER
jgi:energy-converting hydrogenase Eha subunit A